MAKQSKEQPTPVANEKALAKKRKQAIDGISHGGSYTVDETGTITQHSENKETE